MAEVALYIENEMFKAKKDVLCEYSDYFRAMFSGNYVENEQKEIKIDVSFTNLLPKFFDSALHFIKII